MKVAFEGKTYEFPDDAKQPEILSFFEENGVRLKAAGNLQKMAAPPPPAAPFEPSLPGAIGSAVKQASSSLVSSAAALPAAGMRLLEESFNEEGNFRPFYGGKSLVQPDVFGASDMQPAKPGVPLFAGRQDIPRTSGPPAPLQGFADESRMGLQEMAASDPYERRLVGQTAGQTLSDPISIATHAGKAIPLLASMLGAGVVGGPGAAAAVGGAATTGQEFQGARAIEDQGGGPIDDAAQRALLSGSIQGALDAILPSGLLKAAPAAGQSVLAALRRRATAGAGGAATELVTEPTQSVVSDVLRPGPAGVSDLSQLPGAVAQSATDPQRLVDAAIGALVGGGMGAAIGRPNEPPAPAPPPPPAAPRAPLADLGSLEVPGPALQKGATQAPIAPPRAAPPTTGLPREAGPIVTEGERAKQADAQAAAMRQTAPEGPKTIELQMESAAAGLRPGVYLPPGSPYPSVIPQGLAVVTSGSGPEARTLFYDPRKTSKAAAENALSDDRAMAVFLGKAVDGYPAPGAPPAAVVTRAPDGTEIDATEVDPRVPGQVEAETSAQQAKAPGNETAVEDPTFTKFDRWLAGLPTKQEGEVEGPLRPWETRAPAEPLGSLDVPTWEQPPAQDILAAPTGPEAPVQQPKAGRGRKKAAEPPPAPVDPGPGPLFATPADVIEGKDGARGMQPVDMRVPPRPAPTPQAPAAQDNGPLFKEKDPNVTAGGTLTQFPNGRWGFAGRVRGDLGYARVDGKPLTQKDIENARSFGPDVSGVKTRSFATREEALAALAENQPLAGGPSAVESRNERAPEKAAVPPEAQLSLGDDRGGGSRGVDAPLGPDREGGPAVPQGSAERGSGEGVDRGVEAGQPLPGADAGASGASEVVAAAQRIPTTAGEPGDDKKRADAAEWLQEATKALADAKKAKEAAEPGSDRARAAERRIWGAEDDLRSAERSAKTAGFDPEELLRPAPPAAAAPVDSGEPTAPRKYGRESVVKTPDNTRYVTRFTLAEAEELVPSHDDDLNPRPDYDPENQPRDRETVASEDQIHDISVNHNPPELGDSPLAKDGAPIVNKRRRVLSGNGRTIATQRVYRRNMPGAARYRAWLRENAEDFGFTAADVDAMKNPMLVREIDDMSPEGLRAFVEKANDDNKLAMSPAEIARIDARRLTPELLARFEPGEDGSMLGDKNMEFVRGFMSQVVGKNKGDLLDPDGSPNKLFLQRMRNAVLARAFGEAETIQRITQSLDDNVKLVSAALTKAAPAFAKAKGKAERGEAHSVDASPDVAKAAGVFSKLRVDGTPVATYLQDPRSVTEMSPEARIILSVFGENARSAKRMGAFLQDIANRSAGEGDIRQESMFGDEDVDPPTKREIVEGAARAIGNSLDVDADPHGQESLFLKKGGTGKKRGVMQRVKDILSPTDPDIFSPDEIEAANEPPPPKPGARVPLSERPFKEGTEDRMKPGEKGTARDEIMKFVEKGLKTLVRAGRMGHGEANTAGLFQIRTEVIRTKEWGDLETLAHETGHALSKVLSKAGKGWVGAPRAALRELNRLGVELYGPNATVSYNEEGFAEYVAARVRGEDLMQDAPEFHQWYEANAPEAEKQFLDDLADLYDKWDRMGSLGRGRSQIKQEPHGFVADATRKAKDVRRLLTKAELVDKFDPLREITKEIAESQGTTIDDLAPSLNPFATATSREGNEAGVVEGMVGRAQVDTNIKKIGKALNAILKPLIEGMDQKAIDAKLKDLELFGIALRSLERVKVGMLPIYSVKESNEIVKRLDSPEFRTAAKELTEWNHGLNVWRVQSGLATQEQVDKWEAANPVYIPGKRFFDPDENPQLTAGHGPKGFTGQTHGARRVTADASNRQFVSPLDAMVEEAQRTVTAAHKQMVFNALVKLAKRTSQKHGHQLVRKVEITKVPQSIRLETISGDLVKAGANLEEADMEALLTFWKDADKPDTKDPILPYRNADGEMEWFEVDPRVYRALTQIDYQSPAAQIAGKIFGAAKRGVTSGATEYNPGFWFKQIFLADPTTAAVFAKHAPRNPLAAFKGLIDAGFFSDKHKTEAADTFIAAGGKLAGLVANNHAEAGKLWRRAIGEQGRLARFKMQAELLETGPRVKEFEAAYKYALDKWGNEADALTYALVAAKDLTVNFTRSGYQAKEWNQSVPFFNASIQGASKLIRTLSLDRENWAKGGAGRRFVNASIWNISVPSLLLWAFNKDQEWYQQLSDEDRDKYWYVGDDRNWWVKLRKPFTVGQIFGSLPVVMAEALEAEDASGVAKELKAIAKSFLPASWVPPAFQTPAELLGNYKTFPDYEPIVPSYMQSGPSAVLPKDRKRESTLPAAKALGELTGMAPLKWEHALNASTGGLATRTLRYGSDLLDIATGERPPALTDIPGLGSMLNTRTRQGRSVEDLYSAADELSQRRNSGEEVDEARLKVLNDAIKDLRDLRKTPGLSREELAAQTTALARAALEEAKAVSPRLARKASRQQSDILAP